MFLNFIISFLQKTVAQKIVIGLTGLGLCFFLLIHMIGNLFILKGPEAYNSYAYKLHKFPGFIVLELGLLIVFASHILLSLLLQFRNSQARGTTSYQTGSKGLKKTSFIHHYLWQQGLLFILFLIIHLLSFKFGAYYETELDGKLVRDIYRLVVEDFKKTSYILGYSFILFLLSLHVFRGFPASFKTLGLSHPTYVSWVESFSWFFTGLVILGFLAPIWYIYLFL